MRTPKAEATPSSAVQPDWQQALEKLVEQVRSWAEARQWNPTNLFHILEDEGSHYTAPGLEIGTPLGQLVLEPIGRHVLGAEGRVDLYAWPTLYRVMLLRTPDDTWVVRTDSGLDWPHPWSETTFGEVAEGLLKAS